MRASVLILSLAVAGAAAFAASAQSPRADAYEITPADGGFFRKDRDTGVTAFCAERGEGYVCAPAKDAPPAPPATDLKRLEARIAALEEQVKTLGSGLPPVPPLPKDGALLKDEPAFKLPSEKEIDDVASFVEKALRRMKRLATELEKDLPPADEQRL